MENMLVIAQGITNTEQKQVDQILLLSIHH